MAEEEGACSPLDVPMKVRIQSRSGNTLAELQTDPDVSCSGDIAAMTCLDVRGMKVNVDDHLLRRRAWLS